MKVTQVSTKDWGTTVAPPKLNDNQWNAVQALGLVFLVMAVAQLVTFSDFKAVLSSIGLGREGSWAVGLVVFELWAAASFSKLRLSSAFRTVGNGLAILASGFWFIENLRVISDGTAVGLTNSGFFGNYLTQTPGWWTAIEVTALMLCTLHAVNLVKNSRR